MSAPRPFAVFDIDGTILRWQLYHALADELVRAGRLDRQQFEKVREARMNWKRRSHAASFREYEDILVRLFETAITNVSVKALQQASRKVIDEYKDQVYTYTRDLIRDLQARNYLLFAISASQDEIVKMLAEYYGFDDAGGSRYEVKDGYYTGSSLVLMREQKPILLKELVKKHGASWQGSLAVGDSESDIPMLASVEQPIAFNPTRELFERARQENWKVVVERKNMVYELEPGRDGSYLLAQTDG